MVTVLALILGGGCAMAADVQELYTETVEGVKLKLFIPRDTKVVRGILLHSTNYQMNPGDRWAEFCRARDWAHLAQDLAGNNAGRSKRLPQSAEEGLKLFAGLSGHPELVHVPWSAVGHSAGGMGRTVVLKQPARALTNCVSCGWVADPAKMSEAEAAVPYLCTLGAIPDAFKMLPGIEANFEPARKAGRPWGLALQWGCAHDFGNSACLFIPWIAGVESFRVPKDWDPLAGPPTLKPMTEKDGWLGDRSTVDGNFATVASFAEFKGDRTVASWFPDRATAYVWRAMVSKEAPMTLEAAATDGSARLGPPNPKSERGMLVNPGRDLTLKVSIHGGIDVKLVEFFDGETALGVARSAPWEFLWKAPAQGPHPTFAVMTDAAGQRGTTNPALITIRKYESVAPAAEVARPEDDKR